MAEYLRQGVKKLMECPVCLETPQFTPIYRCSEGHILCKDCRGRVENCAVCNVPMGSERCLLAEQILYQLPARCKYVGMGCQIELLDRDKIKEHQIECPDRPVRCISIFCKKEMQIGRLAEHLKECHKCGGPEILPHTGTIFISEDIFKKDLCWCWMTYFCVEGRNLFSLIARTVGGLWHAWVYECSSKRDLPFRYRFVLSSKDDKNKLQYEGDCLSVEDFIVDEIANVVGAAPRLMFDDSTVRSFAKKASPQKLKVPGDENLILGYYVETSVPVLATVNLSEGSKYENMSGGDGSCKYNDVINEMPQIGSKLNMWKQH